MDWTCVWGNGASIWGSIERWTRHLAHALPLPTLGLTDAFFHCLLHGPGKQIRDSRQTSRTVCSAAPSSDFLNTSGSCYLCFWRGGSSFVPECCRPKSEFGTIPQYERWLTRSSLGITRRGPGTRRMCKTCMVYSTEGTFLRPESRWLGPGKLAHESQARAISTQQATGPNPTAACRGSTHESEGH